eukprot:Gb_41265 [translate_table: standard]
MPLRSVSKIMTKALPPGSTITKEAKESVQACLDEFMWEASDKCRSENKPVIDSKDFLWGMKALGFTEYIRPFKAYLGKYREVMKMEKEDRVDVAGRVNRDAPSDGDNRTYALPLMNIGRIMKRVLPKNALLSKGANQAVQQCVTEFICLMTGEAIDKCLVENQISITGDDLLWGMDKFEFGHYTGPLSVYLGKLRENQGKMEEKRKYSSQNTVSGALSSKIMV